MNNKGLTIVELITTFALTAVIIILLMNVVVIIKEVYSNTNIKTELYIAQGNLSNALNKKLSSGNLVNYTTLTDGLLNVNFNLSNEEIELVVTEKEIKFGDYIYKLGDKTRVENPTFEDDGTFLILNIPIKNELYPTEDFGINLVYLLNIEIQENES